MTGSVRNVLSIAGSDSSGGAGIQADLKTFAALGVYGATAITALTAQNTRSVSAVLHVSAGFVRQQLDAVFGDVEIDAVKIGMLGDADVTQVVIDSMRTHAPPIIVLDPVLRATTGAALLDARSLEMIRAELLPLVTVVTPNVHEAGALLGMSPARSVDEAREAASLLVARGARAALVTGGHLGGDSAVDVLSDGARVTECHVTRVPGVGRHGTGCTLSSAIAALCAMGHSLPDACRDAQRFVATAIQRGSLLRVGHGAGPVWQDAAR